MNGCLSNGYIENSQTLKEKLIRPQATETDKNSNKGYKVN